ncbi:MAG: stage III sporulation protein AE [Bacillota bacterium]|nr:stage III sporulation protein AE [Bacillota bacterium]
MKKRIKVCFLLAEILCAVFLCSLPVLAKEEEDDGVTQYMDRWLESMDMSGIDSKIEEVFPEFEMNTEEMLQMILEGRAADAGKELISQVLGNLKGELLNIRQVFLYILVLGVASALFSGFSDLFAGQQIAQAGFYFLYLFLMMILTKVFALVSEIAANAIEEIVLFVKLFIPTYFMAVGAAQGTTTAVYYYQLMLIIAYLVESFLKSILLPFIYSYVLLALLNGIWVEEKLSLLLDFIKKGIIFALKLSMGAVTGLSLVQAVIVPVVDRLKISALRKAVSSIPGIGGVAEGVAELVLGSAVLLKNSMGVLLLLILLGTCLMPLLKILLITGAVKLGAAITGIVSDKRISACADRVSEGCFLLFRCVFTAMALFIIVIAVVAYTVSS